jgi:hypothetical protein
MILPAGYNEPQELIVPSSEIIVETPRVAYVKYKKWWNTKDICQAGRLWSENKAYCPFPEDTKAYDEFWDEQEFYIRNGFKHEGELVAGLEYLYVNYCPIWNKREKRFKFPFFRSPDEEWFSEIESVMGIGMYQNDIPERNYLRDYRPVGHGTAKTRQSGHSLKGVVPLLYNMHFVPGSRNFIGAHLKAQAQKTNTMYQHYHRHLFAHTAWGKRWLRKDEGEEYITGYQEQINGQWVDAGFLSYLKIIGFSDSVEKGVGGGVDLFIIEEAGVFPGLLEAIGFVKNACKDGDITTGSIIVYGAAGSLEKAADLQELSYNPTAYDFKAYENQFDPNPIPGRKIIYFVPNYSCRPPHIDEDGNPNQEAAIIAKEESLKELKRTNFEKYLQEASQMPNSLQEMFAIRQRTRFEAMVIDPHLAWLEARRGQLSEVVELFLDTDSGKVKYRFIDRVPIWDYPIPKELDKTGAVEIFEFPPDDPPFGMYIAAIDSYNQQDSTTDSLGCIQIFKTAMGVRGESMGRILVAEYYARPDDKTTFYRNCLYLQMLYNAVALVENEDTEIVPWYYNKGFDHMLANQPEIIRSIIPNSKTWGKRAKGIHAVWPLIKGAENRIQRYLEEQIGIVRNEQGEAIGEKLGVTRILSLGTMRELKRYVSDPDMNFDRVRTLGWLLMYEDETLTMVQAPAVSTAAAHFLTNTGRALGGGDSWNMGMPK